MHKVLVGVLATVLVTGLSIGGEANPRGDRGYQRCGFSKGHGKGQKDFGFYLRMRETLELTDAQVAKLKAIKMKVRKKQIANEAEMKTLHLDLEDLMSEEKVNRKKVDSMVEKLGDLHSEMKKMGIHSHLDAKAVLTSEQLKKVKEHKKGKHGKKYKMGSRHPEEKD